MLQKILNKNYISYITSNRSPLVQRQLFDDWCCINFRKEVVKKINKTSMIVELYAMILVRPNPSLAQNLFHKISGSILNRNRSNNCK